MQIKNANSVRSWHLCEHENFISLDCGFAVSEDLLLQVGDLDFELLGTHSLQALKRHNFPLAVGIHAVLMALLTTLFLSDFGSTETRGDKCLVFVAVVLRVSEPIVQVPLTEFAWTEFAQIIADIVLFRVGIEHGQCPRGHQVLDGVVLGLPKEKELFLFLFGDGFFHGGILPY